MLKAIIAYLYLGMDLKFLIYRPANYVSQSCLTAYSSILRKILGDFKLYIQIWR